MLQPGEATVDNGANGIPVKLLSESGAGDKV
jgi:hypothetical protein